jgi:hypothetical protein
MQLSQQTSNILNGVKWQLLRSTQDSAAHVLTHLAQVYSGITSRAGVDIYNSIANLQRANVTTAQWCEWLELNKGYRVKNKKDYEYLVFITATMA